MRANVIAIIRRATTFLRWLFSAEQLPSPSAISLGASAQRQGFAAWLFTGDELANATCGPSATRHRRNWLRWVLSSGQLPPPPDKPPVLPACPYSFWGRLLGGEELRESNVDCILTSAHPAIPPTGGEDSSGAFLGEKSRTPRVGFFRWLFSPDVCQRFEESPRRVSRGFWRWVFSSESFPCVEEPPRPRPKGFWHWVASPDRL